MANIVNPLVVFYPTFAIRREIREFLLKGTGSHQAKAHAASRPIKTPGAYQCMFKFCPSGVRLHAYYALRWTLQAAKIAGREIRGKAPLPGLEL
ncbi:MAG TPA: hypothetical protein DEA73_08805 [Peptococcaceae bacterium]|nr:hypothetical protein [Peptococcaceae bacterium]